jgi:hypothetical protein
MRNIFVAALAALSASVSYAGQPAAAGDDYDRLDGKGASGKKVDVVEWEGNLEVHVYPVRSLKGLALKIDRTNKDKPVMVIGYRFDNAPKQQLIRRAILGIDLRDGFKTYRDPSADDYDKIIITNNTLTDTVVAYKLDPAPTQLYPDGHPALAGGGAPGGTRQPANTGSDGSADAAPAPRAPMVDDAGTIQPFFTRDTRDVAPQGRGR